MATVSGQSNVSLGNAAAGHMSVKFAATAGLMKVNLHTTPVAGESPIASGSASGLMQAASSAG